MFDQKCVTSTRVKVLLSSTETNLGVEWLPPFPHSFVDKLYSIYNNYTQNNIVIIHNHIQHYNVK